RRRAGSGCCRAAMKMSRSLMAHLPQPVATPQCGIRARIAQTFWKILPLRRGVAAAQGAEEPGAGIGPAEVRAAGGDAEGGRGLGDAQAREVAELDQLGRLGVGPG